MLVHAVLGLAFAYGLQVHHPHLAFADVAEFGFLLQAALVASRYCLFGRCLCQRAVAQASAAGAVHHFVLNGFDFCHRYAPLRCGSGLQHLAGGGTHAAHGHEKMAHAARAVHVLVAVAGLIGFGLYHLHHLPLGFHLVGHHHG